MLVDTTNYTPKALLESVLAEKEAELIECENHIKNDQKRLEASLRWKIECGARIDEYRTALKLFN